MFIRPSTDAAALIAMAHVIVTEGLHDQAFLDRHVLGFDEAHLPPGAPAHASYRSYLLGLPTACARRRSGRRPSPACRPRPSDAWPSSTPRPSPPRCSAATRPGARLYGEQFHRAAYALCAITGNVGTLGGNSGVSNGATGRGGIKSLPPGANPATRASPTPLLADLLARGKAGGYPADIKMVYSAGGDLFNQAPNVDKTRPPPRSSSSWSCTITS